MQMLSHIRLAHLRFLILSDSLPHMDSSCDCLTDTFLSPGLLLPARASGFVRTGGAVIDVSAILSVTWQKSKVHFALLIFKGAF